MNQIEGLKLFELDGPTRTMGFDMNQNRLAVPVWSYAMEQYCPQRIVELGSYNGGFTIALAFSGWTEGVSVYSFDLMEAPKEEWRDIAKFLGIAFYKGDIWDMPMRAIIQKLIESPGITFLLCDGGNKKEEFRTFAPFLKPGDVIAAHDFQSSWWESTVEVHPSDTEPVALDNALVLWQWDLFKLAGWVAYRK